MSTRDYSYAQEKRIAKITGGKVTPNSGGTQFGGGDVLTDNFLIEAKTTTKEQKSFTIQKEWIDKAKEQAYEQNKPYSTLAIAFDPGGPDFYLVDQRLFNLLLETLEGEKV